MQELKITDGKLYHHHEGGMESNFRGIDPTLLWLS